MPVGALRRLFGTAVNKRSLFLEICWCALFARCVTATHPAREALELAMYDSDQIALRQMDSVSQTHCDAAIEIVVWVVHRPGLVCLGRFIAIFIPIADEKLTSRHLFRHKCEVSTGGYPARNLDGDVPAILKRGG